MSMSRRASAVVHEAGLFRVALGAYLFYYYATLIPDFFVYFGPSSMIAPGLLPPPRLSPLFLIWHPAPLLAALAALLVLLGLFTVGIQPKRLLIPLWLLHLSFHHANPLIIHEPQQLANLFLLCCFFLPIDSGPALLSAADPTPLARRQEQAAPIIRLLLIALAVYYAVSGLKKLPDPLWRSGSALWYLLQWPPFGKPNAVTALLLAHPTLAVVFTYGTLAFELSVPFLLFTRRRPLLLLAGVVFHGLIALTMEVGGFMPIMLVWYALALDARTRAHYAEWINRMGWSGPGRSGPRRVRTA